MPPQLPSSVIDADPFASPFEHSLIENPGNQITAHHYPGMINEFLKLYRQRSLIGEESEELQEFLNQVYEFERKYEISYSLLVKVKQAVMCRSDLFSLQNPLPGVNRFLFMDLVDLIRQAEIIQNVQIRRGNGGVDETRLEIPPPPNYNNIIVNIPVGVTCVQVSTTLSRPQIFPLTEMEPSDALLHPEEVRENINDRCRPPRAKKSMKLGKTFFPLTVQGGLSVFTSVFGSSGLSSSAEAKQLVHIAAISNMVGYIGCLADILLRHSSKLKAAEIIGRIASTAAVFGFLTMMGTLLGLKPVVMIGVAAITALVFFLAVVMQ